MSLEQVRLHGTCVITMAASRLRIKLLRAAGELNKIPAVRLLTGMIRQLGETGAGDMAGSIAYYAFLSMFPLLLGIVALLGVFLPSETVQAQVTGYVEQYLPGSARLVQQNISAIIEMRGALGLVSVIGLFWTGSAVFGAIGRVINRAWGIHSSRPFYLRKLRDLSIAVGASIIFLFSMAATAFASIVPSINLPGIGPAGIIASRAAGFILILAMLLLTYKFMPNTRTQWRHIWLGALIAAVLFEAARSVFAIYLESFASYDLVYGSIATIIITLVWIYISAFILVIGAVLSSEYNKMQRERVT